MKRRKKRRKTVGDSRDHRDFQDEAWWATLDDSFYGQISLRKPGKITAIVEPLRLRLREFDSHRMALETRGGSAKALMLLTDLLNGAVSIGDDWYERRVKLSEPHEIRYALSDVAPGVLFDVRKLESGFPAYFLARRCVDRWREHSVIVEDLHMSPGYPLTDPRFVLSMRAGRESISLRMSHLRDRTRGALGERCKPHQVDVRMFEVGAQVLESAWHEDQWLAFTLAHNFEIPELRQAVEALYLCLDRDLFDLRSRYRDEIETFFEDVYPQPVLARLLARIPALDGETLARLRQQAEVSYRRLQDAFASLLGTSVRWGPRHEQIPMWKLIYANLPRLPQIAGRLVAQRRVKEQLALLREAAVEAAEEVLAA